jgi:hypothetical protein
MMKLSMTPPHPVRSQGDDMPTRAGSPPARVESFPLFSWTYAAFWAHVPAFQKGPVSLAFSSIPTKVLR